MIELIEKMVCVGECINSAELHERSEVNKLTRKKEAKETRQIVMYLSCLTNKYTLAQVGAFYSQDHATVINANKRVNNLIDTEKKFKEKIEEYKRRMETLGQAMGRINVMKEMIKPLEDEVDKIMIRLDNIRVVIKDTIGEIEKHYIFDK